ncbi:toxin-antitoxin system YwqK family antitoxin [Empedobacter brevis]
MKRILLTLTFSILAFGNLFSQEINLDEYEIYVGDTLIAKSDFIKNGQNLPPEKAEKLEFKPISNGEKISYYFNGNIYSKGLIKNLKENGFWEYWHSNGTKAREGEFVEGKPNGTHKYWYENGQLRGIGNWKNGIYDGKWEMYNENGKEKTIQNYKDGKLIE